jgi:hypothetical protein
MFILDPGSEFFFHPGSGVEKFPDPDPQQIIEVYLTHKGVTKPKEI